MAAPDQDRDPSVAAAQTPHAMSRRQLVRRFRFAVAVAVLAGVCLVVNASLASASAVVNTITVGSNPEGVSSDGTDVWVVNSAAGTVSEIDASSGTVVKTITVGGLRAACRRMAPTSGSRTRPDGQ